MKFSLRYYFEYYIKSYLGNFIENYFKIFKKIFKHPLNWLSKETKRHASLRFFFVFLIIGSYFFYATIKFGAKEGFLITAVTWSFFVFCTPIADAGFLLDFPIRLVTGLKMLYSEILVWVIAFFINLYALLFSVSVYNNSFLLKIFYKILSTPSNWVIIGLSLIGTFLSVYFGDELIDMNFHHEREKYHKHLNKFHLILIIFLIVLIMVLYDVVLKEMGISLV